MMSFWKKGFCFAKYIRNLMQHGFSPSVKSAIQFLVPSLWFTAVLLILILPSSPLFQTVTDPAANQLWKPYHLRYLILLVGLLISIFSILVIAVLVNRLLDPIRRLSTTAGEIGKGDLSARCDVSGKDEIGFLATAFNSMVSRIRESEGQGKAVRLPVQHEADQPGDDHVRQ